MTAIDARNIAAGDIVVIRYEGPRGARECARCSASRGHSLAKG